MCGVQSSEATTSNVTAANDRMNETNNRMSNDHKNKLIRALRLNVKTPAFIDT